MKEALKSIGFWLGVTLFLVIYPYAAFNDALRLSRSRRTHQLYLCGLWGIITFFSGLISVVCWVGSSGGPQEGQRLGFAILALTLYAVGGAYWSKLTLGPDSHREGVEIVSAFFEGRR